jgi:hypothetical protein
MYISSPSQHRCYGGFSNNVIESVFPLHSPCTLDQAKLFLSLAGFRQLAADRDAEGVAGRTECGLQGCYHGLILVRVTGCVAGYLTESFISVLRDKRSSFYSRQACRGDELGFEGLSYGSV